MDNASNNNTLLEYLADNAPDNAMMGSTSRVFCILHIINLVEKV